MKRKLLSAIRTVMKRVRLSFITVFETLSTLP